MTYTTSSSTQNIHIGACRVVFNGVDLGFTQGGVDVEVKTDTHQVMVDQFGKTVVDEIILGRSCQVKVPMAETTLQNLVSIMPGAALVTDHTDATKKRVDVSTGSGVSLLSIAKVLNLHPRNLPDNDLSQDFTIPLAMTSGALNFAYQLDKERIFSVTFMAYAATDGLMFQLGDTTAVSA